MASSLRLIAGCALFLLMQIGGAQRVNAQTVPCFDSNTDAAHCQVEVPSNTTAPAPVVSQGVRFDHGVGNVLFDFYPECVFIASNASGNDYFIPQATWQEFSAFLENPPLGVSFANCVPPLTYVVDPPVPISSYIIYAEGGAITAATGNTPVSALNVMVPTDRTLTSGFREAPATTTVSVVNQSSGAPIQFLYTRQDCVNDPYLDPPACNTWYILESYSPLTFNAASTSPMGTNSAWVLAPGSPVITYSISTSPGGPWTPITVDGIPGGTPGIYNNDYQPPVIQSCTVGAVTYQDGETWTSTATTTQAPTAAECPLGAGTRLDTMQSTVTNICNNGTSAIQSSTTPVEVSFTGMCAAAAPAAPGGNIYVVDSNNDRVEVFDMNGNFVFQFGSQGTGNGQFSGDPTVPTGPWTIRLGPTNSLWVTDDVANRVEAFDTSGNYISQISVAGTPDMAAQAPNGNIWVTGLNNSTINEFSSAGASILSQATSTHWPTGVAFDSAGNTWMAFFTAIVKLDSGGNKVSSFGTAGTGPGQFGFVWTFAFDPATGNIWVPDINNDRIEVFDGSGNYLFEFGAPGSGPGQFGTGVGNMNGPQDLAFDPQGNVWVVDNGNKRIEEFDNKGNFLFQFGAPGTGPGQFSGPTSLAITSPTAQTCSSGGNTYSNGQTWTGTVTTTQPATVAECPSGPGTRVDSMQSNVTYICTGGSAAIQSSSTPVEVASTGLCVNGNGVCTGPVGGFNTASCFLNSIGVSQHLAFNGTVFDNEPLELGELQYLGVNHVRDGVITDATKFITLAQSGIVFDLDVGAAGAELSGATLPAELSPIAQLQQAVPGSVYAVEGPNELNTQIVYWQGDASSDPAAAVDIQQALYGDVKGNATLSTVPVVNNSLSTCCAGWQNYLTAEGNMDNEVDIGNFHVYTAGTAAPQPLLSSGIGSAAQAAPGKPVFISEFGYTTPLWASEAQAGYLTLDGIADSFYLGAKNMFVYELMDGNTGDGTAEDNFGLFHSDTSPKPAATAIHNMTAILAATGTTPPTSAPSPAPSVSGLSASGYSLPLLNGKGGFDILVWDEGSGSNATVNLGATYGTVNVYDPVQGATPVQTLTNVNQVTLQVGTDLLIITAESP